MYADFWSRGFDIDLVGIFYGCVCSFGLNLIIRREIIPWIKLRVYKLFA